MRVSYSAFDVLRFLTTTFAVTIALPPTALAQPSVTVPAEHFGLAPLSVVVPVKDCVKLSGADISAAVGSATHITTAEVVMDAIPAAYCRVTGYVEPAIKFEVRLPLKTWTQRYVQTGCGGLCGNLHVQLSNTQGCYPAEHGELVLASTDMGHESSMGGAPGGDAEFGKDPQLRIDFAYRGVHVTALAAKALIAAFYGQAPRYSYFAGCSDGGREALMEAQRYPQDFNGITAGAPAMNFVTQNTFYHGWNAIENTNAKGQPILMADDLPILHQAVLQACDAADGLKDGLISDPLSCHFDPAVVECKADQEPKKCLTHEQVETARAIYEGAHDSAGNKMVLSGPLPGSELAWAGVYIPSANNSRVMSPGISLGTLKYLAYERNGPESYTLADLKITPQSFTEATELHALYDATDPDLSRFEQSGGKLILWHGLADPHISPLNTIAYYTAMNTVMGSSKVKKFARLYLFPGGYHCAGGEGPFSFDLMSTMMAWVERDAAPNALIASHTPGEQRGPGAPPGQPAKTGMPPAGVAAERDRPGPTQPRPATAVDRTRPVYPYPLTTRYKGTGSIDDAKNFGPGSEKTVVAAQLNWLGKDFYSPHYEVWCTAAGEAMTCKQGTQGNPDAAH